jgi:hypothetical protein
MYCSLPSAGSRPARLVAVAVAAVTICCCSFPVRGGIAVNEHVVSSDHPAVALPAAPAPSASSSTREFDSSGHLIADAITGPNSSSDAPSSWLVFWQGAPAQPAAEHVNEVTTTNLPSDVAATPHTTATPLPIPVPNAFSAGTVGLLMLGCIMALRRSRRWLA